MTRRTMWIGVVIVAVVAAGLGTWFVLGRSQPEPVIDIPRTEELFAPGTPWRYISAEKVPADWYQPQFGDTGWSNGLPSGSARGTIHLRHPMQLKDVAGVTAAALQVRTARGVTVYVNGEPAAEAEPGSDAWRNLDLSASLLRDGRNVVAVALDGSGSAAFDASMQVFRSSPAPAGPPWRMVTTKFPYSQSSGVAVASDGLSLWFNEDFRAERPGAVYLMRPDGTVRSWLQVPAADRQSAGALDTEAISVSGGYLYVADIGNPTAGQAPGAEQRPYYTITRFPVPSVETLKPGENVIPDSEIEHVRFTYGTPAWQYRNGEAFVVDPQTGRMLVIEKRGDANAAPRLYDVPPAWGNEAPVEAPEVGTIKPSIVGISDAAVSPDGRSVWLRDGSKAYQYVVPEGGNLRDAFLEPPVRTVALPEQPQGEGLAVDPSGQFLIATSEGVEQPVWGVPLTP